jgi:dTDP-4-dehydrorhamnose reductase
MKILLTGATGLLGPAFARVAAAAGHEVAGVAGHSRIAPPGVARLHRVDLTDPATVARLLAGEGPGVIVNAAAIADPAACQADPAGSRALNVDLPGWLARHAALAGCRLIHLSSEQVFDGEHAPYGIAAPPAPLHLYGSQKAESERAVLGACPAAAVLRAPLLLGNSPGGRRSPHEKMFEGWAAGRPARLYTDELRQVCSAGNLAEVLLELTGRPDLRGIFHWAGAKPVSRWEMGRAITRHFGVDEGLVQAVARADTPEISAHRPRDLTLDLAPLDRELRVRPETLAEAVAGLDAPTWWSAPGKDSPPEPRRG